MRATRALKTPGMAMVWAFQASRSRWPGEAAGGGVFASGMVSS